MSIQTAITRSGSATSLSITDPLALSPTNRLNPAERKARNHVDQAGRLARIPSGFFDCTRRS
ncbi:hypothetical protein P692DRAFT_20833235 [Suillus brevipes Sb2]|nr:hypothetical protein P692DRAFT_20833235 [Suillus brevipes Sb2]